MIYHQWNAPNQLPPPTYDMGFKIDGKPIPDPMSFTGKESDLDTMGERDATGYLHRNMVATKRPLHIEYENVPWIQIIEICTMIRGKDQFQFTFPDPFRNGESTITAYAGDREFECVWAEKYHQWMGNLKFSVIEY